MGWISERKNASDSSSVRLSSAEERHEATPAAATCQPPESASGAPGERVHPLVQYFDLKAQDAKLDARNAASARAQDAQHRWPPWAEAKLEAKLGDPAAEKDDDSHAGSQKRTWEAGFTERLERLDLGREDTSSERCSTLWDHEGHKITFPKNDGAAPYTSAKKGSVGRQPAPGLAPWKRGSQPASSALHAPRSQKQTAPVGGNDHISIASSSGDRCAEAPWRQPDHSNFQPPAPNPTPEENEQTPWYVSPTPMARAGALAPPVPTASPDLVSPPGASQKHKSGGAYTRPMPPAPSRSPAPPVSPCFVSPHGVSEQGSAGGAYIVDLQEDRDVTMSDRSGIFGTTDKKANKGKVPCNRCDVFSRPST
jgi:hypothetical protein